MKKFLKRPVILLTVLFLVGFVIILYKLCANYAADKPKSNENLPRETQRFKHKIQHLFDSDFSNQLDDLQPTLNSQITLGY